MDMQLCCSTDSDARSTETAHAAVSGAGPRSCRLRRDLRAASEGTVHKAVWWDERHPNVTTRTFSLKCYRIMEIGAQRLDIRPFSLTLAGLVRSLLIATHKGLLAVIGQAHDLDCALELALAIAYEPRMLLVDVVWEEDPVWDQPDAFHCVVVPLHTLKRATCGRVIPAFPIRRPDGRAGNNGAGALANVHAAVIEHPSTHQVVHTATVHVMPQEEGCAMQQQGACRVRQRARNVRLAGHVPNSMATTDALFPPVTQMHSAVARGRSKSSID